MMFAPASFGKPQAESACECERSAEANLAQSLHLLNSTDIQGKLAAGDGRCQPDNVNLIVSDANNNKSTAQTTSTVILADDDAFIKPERDPRQYRMIRLANQLRQALPDLKVQTHCGGGSFKSQMKKADPRRRSPRDRARPLRPAPAPE